MLHWHAAPKTGNRDLMLAIDPPEKDGKVLSVKIFARSKERLDPVEVLKKASLFEFTTGTYADAVTNYFGASTKDGRNALQFDVTEQALVFRALIIHP